MKKLAESKFLQIYNDNEEIILKRRKEFESNINIKETLKLCEQLYHDEEIEKQENRNIAEEIPEPPPFKKKLTRIQIETSTMTFD